MISLKKVLRFVFGSKKSISKRHDDYRVWAQTEYKKDWQFAYQHMIDNEGQAPNARQLDGTINKNLAGWV
jgi:hypothetical protein